ncbi:hypothetical protein ACLKA7_007996 [Drosophila subpalustris]
MKFVDSPVNSISITKKYYSRMCQCDATIKGYKVSFVLAISSENVSANMANMDSCKQNGFGQKDKRSPDSLEFEMEVHEYKFKIKFNEANLDEDGDEKKGRIFMEPPLGMDNQKMGIRSMQAVGSQSRVGAGPGYEP